MKLHEISFRFIKSPYSLIAILTLLHFCALMTCHAPAISTPDANGYFAQARHIAEGFSTGFTLESPVQYVNVHWHNDGNGHYYSKYPPGLPALLAVPYRFFGAETSLLVNPVMASLTVAILCLLTISWIGPWWGLMAGALLAVNPTVNQHALSGDSHTAVLFFLVTALYCMTRWKSTMSKAWALFAGLFLGMIPATRYPEVLLLLPFAFLAVYSVRRDREGMVSLLFGAIGAAIPLGALCIRNQLAFGAFWKTGYNLMEADIGFGWQYFFPYSVSYLKQLQGDGLGAIFGLGIVGIAVLCTRRDTREKGTFLALLTIPLTILYMFYFWPPDRASMRFLMPTFPAYIIAGVWLLKLVGNTSRHAAIAGGAVLLVLTAIWGIPGSAGHLQRLKNTNKSLAEVTDILSAHIAPGDIVVADQMVCQHLDFIGTWRIADLSPLSSAGRMRGGSFNDRQRPETEPENMPQPGQRIKGIVTLPDPLSFEEFTKELGTWASDTCYVYWLISEDQLDDYESQLPFWEDFTVVATIKTPPLTMFGGMGGGGAGRRSPGMMGGRITGRSSRRGTDSFMPGGQAATRTFLLARWER